MIARVTAPKLIVRGETATITVMPRDGSGAPIDLPVGWSAALRDRPGGTILATPSVTWDPVGMQVVVTIPATVTATLPTGSAVLDIARDESGTRTIWVRWERIQIVAEVIAP